MEISKVSPCHRLLKIWLLILACQTGHSYAQLETYYSPNDSYLMNSEWPIENNYPGYSLSQNYFPQENNWQTPKEINQEQVQSVIVPSSDYSENEQHNFTTFESPQTFNPTIHPLSQEGEATSYSFEEPQERNNIHLIESDFNKKNPFKSLEESEQEKHIPSLNQGKGNIKIIRKNLEEARENQPSQIIGKKIVDPEVGAIQNPSHLKSSPSNSPISTIYSHPLKTSTEDFESLSLETDSADDELAQISPVPPRTPTIVTPTSPSSLAPANPQLKEISINFNNVAMIEYIRFISRISNKNFIFDDADLQFNVTIVSEEPTSINNLMAALLQELKIRDLALIEQGNNIIIHRNPRVRAPARILAGGTEVDPSGHSEIITRVFRLNTLDPIKASEIIRPLLSDDALVEVLRDTNNVIITDLVSNVNKIAQLIGTLDAPNSGVMIGQYVVRNAFVDSLVDLATRILQPIAQGNPFVLVPYSASNSIYIVSNSFLVEKALAILQNLDLQEGRTKILSLENLRPDVSIGRGPRGTGVEPNGSAPGSAIGLPGTGISTPSAAIQGIIPGTFIPGSIPEGLGPESGGLIPGSIPTKGLPGGILPSGLPGAAIPGTPFGTAPSPIPESYPLGGIGTGGQVPIFTPEGYPIGFEPPPFTPGRIGAEGRPSAIFDETRDFLPGGISAASRWTRELPVGHIERTLFFIYKLRYRRGDQIEIALRKIGDSMQLMRAASPDLIAAINSSQWIESSNALIFTGTAAALDRVKELILEIDVPLRQVFIEMLILDTTIDDSLTYGVDWITRFGGGTTTGEQGFISTAAGAALRTVAEVLPGELPVVSGILGDGYTAGIIGTHLTHNGQQFSTIGALVKAVHTDTKANVVLNPKIITEDNNPAEIFVGETDRYKTQSITNELGDLITNNFQFIDVGTTLRVTPLIGNNDVITLDIIQESTEGTGVANLTTDNQLDVDVNLVPVLRKTRTFTRVHVPNGFFVVLSGMIRDREARAYSRIPCLGGIPIIGSFGKRQDTTDLKRNLMLFIRPLIIDTDMDLEDITKRQQDIYREKSKFRRAWNYELDEALNFSNIKPTDPDEIGCTVK